MAKRPKRYDRRLATKPGFKQVTFGVIDPEMLRAFGAAIAYWPHVEEQALPFFHELIRGYRSSLGMDHDNTRFLYKSIISAQVRIKVMRNLLQKATFNASAPVEYDEIIGELARLTELRNDYVHGLWFTTPDGKTFVTTDELQGIHKNNVRQVDAQEFE